MDRTEAVWVHRERIELDRRALALREAADSVKFDFKREEEDSRPVYERVTEAAMYYYDFLCNPPIIPPNPPQDMRNNLVRRNDGSPAE